MTKFFPNWFWLDDGALPTLVAIVRACWIWPWLGLIQRGVSPDVNAAALPIWLVLLLPLLSFSLARWVSMQPLADSSHASVSPLRNEKVGLPLGPRLLVGLAGIVVAVLVVWWQLYRQELGILNQTWISQMGDSLIHWPETAISPAVLLIASGLLLWMRGLLDAGNSMTHDTVWGTFLMGIVMMVLYLIIISLAELDLVGQLVTSVLIMLAAGMAALAFSSIKITAGLDRALGFGVRQIGAGTGELSGGGLSNEGHIGALQNGSMPLVNRYWFLSVSGVIGLLMLVGILLTLLIAPEVLAAILDGLWAVATFIGDILFNVLLFVGYIFAVIFFYLYQFIEPLIKRLLERFNVDPELLDNFRQEPEATLEPAEIVERAPVPDEFRWLGLAIFAIITLIAFALIIRRLSKSDTEALDEDRESILSADLLQDQLANLWNRLRGRLRGQDPADPFLALDGEETRRRIRAVYQSLLATATEMGQPRGPAFTPKEYEDRLVQSRLSSRIPSVRKEGSDTGDTGDTGDANEVNAIRQFYGSRFAPQLELITAGYVAARYGNEAPSNEVAQGVEDAWKMIANEIVKEFELKNNS